nr:hypothetical protein [Secundilactobacillus kimchicus]
MTNNDYLALKVPFSEKDQVKKIICALGCRKKEMVCHKPKVLL